MKHGSWLIVMVVSSWAGAAIAHPEEGVDVRSVGLPWYWLALGFGAQALFASRMAWQWWVSERLGSSVVPVGFWWLSLGGGALLLVYFLRRGDPVGLAGQIFGVVVYVRNLILIYRGRQPEVEPEVEPEPEPE